MISRLIFRTYLTTRSGSGLSERIHFQDDSGKAISPWHDIPVRPTKYSSFANAVFEISKHNIKKLEMATKEKLNPIKPDTRKNKKTGETEIRYYGRFPLFNYGFIPQTWENSFEGDMKYSKYHGDGDPIDVVEIGSKAIEPGSVHEVKILGAMCLIDQGEADWKIICVSKEDEICWNTNSFEDINRSFPGKLDAIRFWFEKIKTFDGKPENFFEGLIETPEVAVEIIEAGHKHWERLRAGEIKEASYWLGDK
ncbi:unnamed protein product [Blepharisma stoltei]|uniref:inorganic diphosphatase n=1 Tax=Blepharisma stoltei TaxID=1481888 RepID=A0AAU9I9I4_9CILI|nr:unnamed protein product [Blepharisma stoltei]